MLVFDYKIVPKRRKKLKNFAPPAVEAHQEVQIRYFMYIILSKSRRRREIFWGGYFPLLLRIPPLVSRPKKTRGGILNINSTDYDYQETKHRNGAVTIFHHTSKCKSVITTRFIQRKRATCSLGETFASQEPSAV